MMLVDCEIIKRSKVKIT